jgi:hypothetical protein
MTIKLLLIYLLAQNVFISYVRTQYCTSKQNFLIFTNIFNKTYGGPEESEKRYQIWVQNIEEINNLISSGNYTFEIGEVFNFKKSKYLLRLNILN